MVLTGIVVAAASSALALGMALRVVVRSGGPFLSEDAPGERTEPDVDSSGPRP